MLIVHINVHVLPEHVEGFRAASIENARNSIQEPGIARFEVLQRPDDTTRFVFVEVYRDAAAAAAHKETAHYAKWRDAVEPMLGGATAKNDVVKRLPRRHRILMTAFEYATAGRIVFGRGSYSKLRDLVAELGATPMYITGSRRRDFGSFVVAGEPTVEMVREAVAQCRESGSDCVVGIGGGSVIDAAKATAVLAPNDGDVLDYIEVIGTGKTLSKPGLPCIAVPTTAGTGSEVTRNAVIGSPEHGVKASLRSPYLLPRVALVDPELTRDLPREITANTGLDALTQLIEAFLSVRANAFTDALCRDGIPRAAEALPRVWWNGDEIEARTAMSFAALLGGMALANAGLGVVHGFAAPIGGMFHNAPHGAVCAALLPHGIKANYAAASQRAPELLPRFETVARLLTANPNATPEHAVSFLQDLCDEMHVKGLSAYGITSQHVPELVSKAEKASSMKANPLKLTLQELAHILQSAL